MTKGVDHITLTVNKLDECKEFYVNICGMRLIVEEKEYIGLSDGTFSFWLGLPRDNLPKPLKFNRNNVGLDHWAFKVKTMEELKKIETKLKKLKVFMEEGGITDDDFGGTAIFTQDPEGMKVEFHLREKDL
ncbi:VOC family protein [Candidatus Woesearchaeota archaeon]|nr:VOC family protein [Candidatus Woesearchaeota archaeon]